MSTFQKLGAEDKPKVDVVSLEEKDLESFGDQPESVKSLLREALSLTEMELGYKYGSHDPDKGGMDCSGTIYHLLRTQKISDVPRQANLIYKWVWQKGHFNAVVSENPATFELERLKPGDLLFWTGTYKVDRDPPVTHVMLYLGKRKSDSKPVMFGASSGRRYEGKSRHGVSVFDFVFPRKSTASGTRARFIGYGSIPGLAEKRTQPKPKPPGRK